MNRYKREKYSKKLSLFSKDAVKTLSSDGLTYDKFTWNNVRHFELGRNKRLKVANLTLNNTASVAYAQNIDFPAPPPTDAILHYKFNTDFTDTSGNGYDGTPDGTNGTATISNSVYKKGSGSCFFNNTVSNRQSVIIDNGTSRLYNHLHNNPNGITFTFWFRRSAGGVTLYPRIFYGADINEPDLNKNAIHIGYRSDQNKFSISVHTTILSTYTFNFTISDNTWYHISIVCKPNTTNYTLPEHTIYAYVNGVLDSTFTNAYYPQFTQTFFAILGRWKDLSGDYREFHGYLDDFRIYDRQLSADEILSVMWDRYLYIWYSFEDALDEQLNTTLTNTTLSTISKIDSKSLDLSNGTTSCSLTLSDNNVNVFESLDRLTFSFWLYPLSFSGNTSYIVFKQTNCASFHFIDGTKLRIGRGNGTNIDYYEYNITTPLTTWKHYAIVYDFTATTAAERAKLYVDGVLKNISLISSPGSITNTTYPTTTNTFTLGDNTNGFKGYIDDLRIYTFEMTPDDIVELATYLASSATEGIFYIKSKDVYDTYDSDNKPAIIYHQKGTINNKKKINPSFKINKFQENIELEISEITASDGTKQGLKSTDDFILTLVVEDEDNDIIDGELIEDYHKYPQMLIKY